MITFVSLFLGLITGPHTVAAVTGGSVATVEFVLNEEVRAVDREPPWSAEIDFGTRLRPQLLTAIARDARGEEVDRADQWINLPRGRSEAGLVIERGTEHSGRIRLVWQSMEHPEPEAVTVTVDGRELAAAADGTYPIPPLDDRSLHVVRAEIEFAGDQRSHVDAVVGGQFGEGMQVAMTAVPVRFKGRKEPSATSLEGAILADGRPGKVLAVEEGPLDLVVVLERSSVLSLGGHGRQIDVDPSYARTGIVLGEDGQIRFVSATPRRVVSGTTSYDLFPTSEPFGPADGELPYLLTHVSFGDAEGPQRIADAVATAGVQAAAANRRRAVLLVLGHRWEDESLSSPEEVKQYLSDLQVPFVVWTTGAAQSRTISDDRLPMSTKTEWGRAKTVPTITRLMDAVNGLVAELSEQRIVWIEGDHLPTAFTLTTRARGVELVR